MEDLIFLQNNELKYIFDAVNSYQIIFHPYYFKEGEFKHYKEFLMNGKDKIIVNDKIRMYKKRKIRMYSFVHKFPNKSAFFFDIITH